MHFIIYRVTNKLNGKEYTGKHQTENLDDGYMGSGKLIRASINKYGIENFSKEILHIFDNEEDMNLKEKELVTEEYCDRTDTYNLCPGGNGGFGYINNNELNLYPGKRENDIKNLQKGEEARKRYIKSGKHKKIMKEVNKKWIGEKFPEGIWKDKKHKPETIELMKTSARGKHNGSKNSQYGTCWITDGSINKKIKKEELDFWLEQGYHKGRILLG